MHVMTYMYIMMRWLPVGRPLALAPEMICPSLSLSSFVPEFLIVDQFPSLFLLFGFSVSAESKRGKQRGRKDGSMIIPPCLETNGYIFFLFLSVRRSFVVFVPSGRQHCMYEGEG